jgi:hypothetical protein
VRQRKKRALRRLFNRLAKRDPRLFLDFRSVEGALLTKATGISSPQAAMNSSAQTDDWPS